MSTDFFLKKYITRALAWLIVAIFICSIGYAGLISNTMTLPLDINFYFLVSTSTHIEASTHFIEWSGGAGYLLEYKNREYVAFSVYLEEEDGLKVQAALTNEETELLSVSVGKLFFFEKSDKLHFEKIKGAFQSLYGCLRLLEAEISRLSQDGTQESGRRILGILQRQLNLLSKEYENIFPQYAAVCFSGKETLSKMLNGTLFLKDLRHLLCALCMSYTNLARLFSI